MKKVATMFALLITMLIAMSGCSLFSEGTTGGDEMAAAGGSSGNGSYDELLKQVTDDLKELDSAGGAWAYTDELIEKAQEAAKAKDFDKAMKILKDASSETKLARAQLESQKKAGPSLF